MVSPSTVEFIGHECVLADDGAQAWELFRDRRPDVIVTDRVMTGMDGIELCHAVRRPRIYRTAVATPTSCS